MACALSIHVPKPVSSVAYAYLFNLLSMSLITVRLLLTFVHDLISSISTVQK